MSLRVWLPLNGDLRNQGLDGSIIATGNNITEATSGKIGSCYKFANSFIKLNKPVLNNSVQEFSITAWVKFNSNVPSCVFSDRTVVNSTGISLFLMQTGHIYFDTGARWDCNPLTKFPTNAWFHIAFIYKRGQYRKIYLNGVLVGSVTSAPAPTTTSSTWATIGASQQSATVADGNNLDGWMNDWRLYDHALSEKEVKEIAKGLILHYKLDNNGCGGRNLLLGTYNFANWHLSSRWTKDNNIVTYKEGAKAWSDIDSPTIPWIDVQGKTLTISADIRSDDFNYTDGSGFSICFVRKASGPNATGYSTRRLERTTIYLAVNQITSEWKRYSATVANISDSSFRNAYNGGGGDWFGIYIWNYTNKSVQIKNIKLEIGDKATIYSSAPEDYNFSTNIIEDCSGYGHHGIAVNNLTIDQNSAKYDVSTLFSNSSYIKYTNFNLPVNTWTVSCWYYKSANPTEYETIYCLSKNTGADADKKFAAQPNAGRIWFKVESGSKSINKLTINKWALLTISCNGTIGTIYENLTPIGTINAGNMMVDCTDLVLGSKSRGVGVSAIGVPYTGYISDFRIYCTALSADDIKELYQTSASIDDKQNFYSRELSNSLHDTTSITQAGIALADDFVEDAVAAIKDDRSIESNCFYEY